jgi:hypothetical protein
MDNDTIIFLSDNPIQGRGGRKIDNKRNAGCRKHFLNLENLI